VLLIFDGLSIENLSPWALTDISRRHTIGLVLGYGPWTRQHHHLEAILVRSVILPSYDDITQKRQDDAKMIGSL
jgi:hypothetical protein